MDSLDELMARAAQPVEEQKDSLDDLMAASAMGEVGAVGLCRICRQQPIRGESQEFGLFLLSLLLLPF